MRILLIYAQLGFSIQRLSQKAHKNQCMETAIVVPDQKWGSLVDADCLVVSALAYISPLSSQCFPVTSVLSRSIKGI